MAGIDDPMLGKERPFARKYYKKHIGAEEATHAQEAYAVLEREIKRLEPVLTALEKERAQ